MRETLRSNHFVCVGAYGLIHALVDTSTTAVIYFGAARHGFSASDSFWLVVVYNVLAFGAQPLLGFLIDRSGAPRTAAAIGIAMALLGLPLVYADARLSVALGGLGNALFHAGCGAMVLTLRRGRAGLPGLFVGPGAVGLSLGVWLGLHGRLPWPALCGFLLAALGLILYLRPRPETELAAGPPVRARVLALVVPLLLFAVLVRAACGRSGLHVTPSDTTLWFALGVVACTGKCLGGFVADRFGMVQTVLLVFVTSAPLLAFAGAVPATALLGVMLFQMTMPVTLTAMSTCFPSRPSFAFGLTCLALLAGTTPQFHPPLRALLTTSVTFGLVAGATAAICVALWRMGKKEFRTTPARS